MRQQKGKCEVISAISRLFVLKNLEFLLFCKSFGISSGSENRFRTQAAQVQVARHPGQSHFFPRFRMAL